MFRGYLRNAKWLVAVTVLSWLASPPEAPAHDVAGEMVVAADRFLKSLGEDQRAQVSIDFGKEKREAWHYFPSSMMESRGGRRGLAIKEMTDGQRALAHGLLNTALSHRGHLQAMTIMALEAILRDLENGNPIRDPAMYHVAVYGKPSLAETWGWSVEGHHLSVNLTLVDGKRFCTTPSFFGSNPAIVREGPFAGLDTLETEQALARQLVRSLGPEQKKLAVFTDKAPSDIITAADRRVGEDQFQPPQGIPFDKLNDQQQRLLLDLVEAYTNKYRPEIVSQINTRTKIAKTEGMYFAWAGGMEPGEGHYYRIQTPDYLFEYDNVQGGANHIHTVWREFDGDFGADLLREHYETSDHHAK